MLKSAAAGLALCALSEIGVEAYNRFDACKGPRCPSGPVHCGGGPMSEDVVRKMDNQGKWEMTLMARLPIVDNTMRFFNYGHLIGVFFVFVVVMRNMWVYDKPSNENENTEVSSSHKKWGRFLSNWVMWWFFPVAWCLNFKMILWYDVKELLYSPNIADWRAQIFYIIPWGITTMVCTINGFYAIRRTAPEGGDGMDFKSQLTIYIAKYMTIFSLLFSVLVSFPMILPVIFGFGLGNFNVFTGRNDPVPGDGLAEGWYQELYWFFGAIAVPQNMGIDVLQLKLCNVMLHKGRKGVSWKEQHKFSMIIFTLQVTLIVGAFVFFLPLSFLNKLLPRTFTENFASIPIDFAFATPFHNGAALLPFIISAPVYHMDWLMEFLPKLLHESNSDDIITHAVTAKVPTPIGRISILPILTMVFSLAATLKVNEKALGWEWYLPIIVVMGQPILFNYMMLHHETGTHKRLSRLSANLNKVGKKMSRVAGMNDEDDNKKKN